MNALEGFAIGFALGSWTWLVSQCLNRRRAWRTRRAVFKRGYWRGVRAGRRAANRDTIRWQEHWGQLATARTMKELDACAAAVRAELELLEKRYTRACARLARGKSIQ